jgi:hypothetical protein
MEAAPHQQLVPLPNEPVQLTELDQLLMGADYILTLAILPHCLLLLGVEPPQITFEALLRQARGGTQVAHLKLHLGA